MDTREKEYLHVSREIMKKTWDDFDACVSGKKLVVFGTASGAENLLYQKSLQIAYFVDNSEKKWGTTFHNLPVYNPLELEKEDVKNLVVLIASVYISSIATQLEQMGVKYIFSKRFLDYDEKIIKEEDMKFVHKVKDSLCDEKSKEIYMSIVQKRKEKEMDYSDLVEEGKEQYFDSDIIQYQGGEVFVDGGSYNGDTSIKFAQWAQQKYEKIIIYEPMEENIVKIKNAIKDVPHVEIHNKALWNKSEKLKINYNGAGSTINEKGVLEVEAEALDINQKVTFVKLDIEGAEMRALEGMKELIMEQKPRLAICLYHLYDDLWTIPEYIHELVPEYRLYVRHYSKICEETVLYAVR